MEKIFRKEELGDIVDRNFELMQSQLYDLLHSESRGGNAGAAEIEGQDFSCMYANGYLDKNTGEIIAFGNFQHIPQEIREKYEEFGFRIACNLDVLRNQKRIADILEGYRIIHTDLPDDMPTHAVQTVENSVARWNEEWDLLNPQRMRGFIPPE